MTDGNAASQAKPVGFVAYPETSHIVQEAIDGAVALASSGSFLLKPWKAMKVIGFKVDDVVRQSIDEAAVLIADITYPNPNVYYEIGAAIGKGKPVIPIINIGVERAVSRVQSTGLFDTIGWATYTNAQELHEKLGDWPNHSWTNNYTRRTNHSQPLFILDTLIKTDFRNHIFHAVENSKVRYRSFDPTEVPRLTAAQAIAEVSSSAGVIIPIIDNDIRDAELNNLRASFILGLCHGYSVEALSIQYGNGPAPLDYREYITNSTFRRETERHVESFTAEVLIWNQNASGRDRQLRPGLLSEIDLGSATAENETQKLAYYFVRTAEFSRALRAEGAVVIGRKGSGKSAAYLQIADTLLRNKRVCVVDLRPAAHNLSEMREKILEVVSTGVFDHTIAAFWLYIMYVEVVLKLREIVLPRSKNNFLLQERIREIEEKFSLSESVVSGDFTSRLETAVRSVIAAISRAKAVDDVRQQITNAMFEQPIPQLRDAVASFTDIVDEVAILIDDLDKGWPPRQVESQDVTMVKHLIEALNRIRRDLGRRKVEVRHLVFLRSDIYEKLVQETSDRGKYNPIKVDWSDPEQLRHLLRQRVISNVDHTKQDEAWDAINPPLPGGDAVSVMIESSLRRPRFLIDLCERTLSCAINRGHGFVTESDVEEGLRQMALYLVSDFGYEMRDVAGTPEHIFYLFIGAGQLLTDEDLESLLAGDELGLGIPETIELLLWYGFLGFMGAAGTSTYIYDVGYDFRRLEAERARLRGELLYVVNPAFLKGLTRTNLPSDSQNG